MTTCANCQHAVTDHALDDSFPECWGGDGNCPCLTSGKCTEEDHDTTDIFCGACGEQLDPEEGDCDPCKRGEHQGDGFPFCRCCGASLGVREGEA